MKLEKANKNQILDQETRRALQTLARQELIKKMLADIATDQRCNGRANARAVMSKE